MRKLGVLGIALVGVLLLISSVGLFWFPISLFFADIGGYPKVLAVFLATLPFLLSLAGGLFLLNRRDSLAERWFPESESPFVLAADDLLRIGLVLIGVYLFAQAIPSLISQVTGPIVRIIQVNAQIDADLGASDAWSQLFSSAPNILATIVRLVIAWFLVVRSAGIAVRLIGHSSPVQGAQNVALLACPSCGAPFDPSEYEGGVAVPRCTACKQPLDIPHA
jgi:hypothetical protein